jgi:hypothetical protein
LDWPPDKTRLLTKLLLWALRNQFSLFKGLEFVWPLLITDTRRRIVGTGIVVQYVGFQTTARAREYTFQVREAGEDRRFTLNIANDAFVSHRARYQDAPAICSERLQAELAAHSNHPVETKYEITLAELDSYRIARAPKAGHKLWAQKSQDNF